MEWVVPMIVSFVALGFAYNNYKSVKRRDEGTERMREIASFIREGADTFLRHENTAVLKSLAPIAIALMITTTWHVGVAFIFGAIMSMLAGVFGMKSATISNVRVANEARVSKHIGKALKVAYMGGSVMGLSVAGLSILGLAVVYWVFGELFGQLKPENLTIVQNWLGINFIPFTMTVSGYALGCSLMAMFDRVGGGVYTKAADMAADLVGKTELNLPEDDPRNPATIADNVGDNVGDVAGLGADLLESFVGSIVSSIILASYMLPLFKDEGVTYELVRKLVGYPVLFAALGLVGSMIGILYIIVKKPSDDPQKELNIGLWTSAILTLIFGFFLSRFVFAGEPDLSKIGFRYGWISPWGSAVIGIIVGILMGFWAEYYTSDKYRPTRNLSYRSFEGVGMVISGGLALGMSSTFYPILTLAIGILISDWIAGLYGVAISALGMLSFVATAVSTDSYGPIADNAGGISEMSELEEEVRAITDRLDSVGNTTAAIGKGFAIGSAVLAALSLFASYMYSQISPEELGRHIKEILVLNMINARTIAGALIGAALPFLFSGILIESVIYAAGKMVEEIRRQFKEIPGIAEGKARPDYNRCIEISSSNALKRMKYPAMISVLTPLVAGFLLGPKFVGGLLMGTLLSGAMLAIFCANSGGAWDNAKKHLEQGNIEGVGKGTEEHKALVVGDTVGDPLKDTVGPSLDILIKIMSVVSIIAVSIFKVYHLF